jgi:outer membrane protein TolC
LSILLIFPAVVVGQSLRPYSGTNSGAQSNSTGAGSFSSTGASSLNPSALPGAEQSPYFGSVPEENAVPEVLQLSFSDAMDRGLRNNLGLLLEGYSSLAARGQKWKELSALLPHLVTNTSENYAQQNLEALGISGPGIPKIIGPYGFFDTRAYFNESVVDFNAIEKTRGAQSDEKAVAYAYKDARELVVLAVGNAYLQAISGSARIDTAQVELQSAQTLYSRAVDQLNAGVSPAIDVLRAKVELQNRQQQLIAARNDFAKQKLTLARVIGLPLGQEFTLVDRAPYQPIAALSAEESLRRAFDSRSDYQAAVLQVQAAEHRRKAATAEYYPSLDVTADYGVSGINPGNSHGTVHASGILVIPIFQGGQVHADVLLAEASLRQARAQLEDLRGEIDSEVRSAILDLQSAAEQVEVARSSVDLANQTLDQAQDRFSAGVTDNLEVVQAQESVAAANDTYISSLYSHNLAKIALAKAIGYAEQGVKDYLKGKDLWSQPQK